jgi:hypothetical protein
VLSGSLPAGLSLNPITGVLSGTPTTAGSSSFTIAVTDATTASSSRAFTITTAAPAGPTDSVAPTGSVSINGGATTTTSTAVTLALAATDAVGVTAYRLAEGSDCSGASWVTVASATSFSASVGFSLSDGDGTKTVCVQYADAAGNVSGTATATITLDAAPTLALAASAARILRALALAGAVLPDAEPERFLQASGAGGTLVLADLDGATETAAGSAAAAHAPLATDLARRLIASARLTAELAGALERGLAEPPDLVRWVALLDRLALRTDRGPSGD